MGIFRVIINELSISIEFVGFDNLAGSLSVCPVVKFSGPEVQVTGENTSEADQLFIAFPRGHHHHRYRVIKITKINKNTFQKVKTF